MEDMCGVVHALLEGTVCMGEGLCAAAEAHVDAEVVAAVETVAALVRGLGGTRNARLNCDALANSEARNAGPNGCDDTTSFVSED